MNSFQLERRELHRTLAGPGDRPEGAAVWTRRTFLHQALLKGVAGAAACGFFPLLNTLEVAYGQTGQSFRFAWVSDTHLYPRELNSRFVEKTVRAFKEVQAMNPPADFMIFGGDLAQLGDPVELQLGAELLKEVKVRKVFIPGEHDWYLDMGSTWNKTFGNTPWTFDHKGVRVIGLNTVAAAPDFWTARKMTPKERMGHMATLDGTLGGAWSAIGEKQMRWLNSTLSNWPKSSPVILFTHTPLYEYYPPWNFWIRDWREAHEILKPYANVTNIHGHTHQVLYNEIGKVRSIGMLATSWPWPYAPEGVPLLTKPMIRADPGDHFDGVGWSTLTMTPQGRVENEYKMWRKTVFADQPADSGTEDNRNQVLSPRVADRI
ncbi:MULTISPECIES: metallophosphoesterase family protein [Cupriavidus]|uniref:Metallophosphoesterase n=1 Tax=Cupriavidus oxalaticus TaxID=96344 RepID=A0A4P7LBM1_9BURK|nr:MULTISPECIES: metallophosphoesterase [Cupriavidus]MBF6987455.1 metallophosphoesterase [Cupriavidus sp. IK-TO18]QBY53374.1 metallophosphoesterase [Cupriavidus oxalaticus]TDF63547.1 metallophosphoesterase [Cupriavidus sp. L7L]